MTDRRSRAADGHGRAAAIGRTQPVQVRGGPVRPVLAVLGGVVGVLGIVACSGGDGGDPAEPVVRDSAGVRIVENPGSDRPAGKEAERLAELAPPDGALTAVPWGIAADPMSGRVFVADRLGHRVAVFDRKGGYLESFGREGGGPGEFENPSALTLAPGGAPTVWDTGRGILSRWSSEGELLNELRPGVGYWGPGFALGRNRLYTVTSREVSSGTREQRLVSERHGSTEVLHVVSRQMATLELCVSMPAPKIHAPDVVWTSRGDTVWARHGPGYRIDTYVDGELTGSVRRARDPIDVTREMAVRRVRSGPGPYRRFMQRCGVDAEQMVEAVGHEDVVSPVMSISVDPEGRLWVTRTPDGVRPDSVDLLDADGAYVGTMEAPGIPVAFLSSTRFVALQVDRETGRAVPTLYELRATGGGGDGAGSGAPGSGSEAGLERPAWAPPVRRDLREFRDCPGCPVMVELPAGSYRMGSPEGEAPAAEIGTRPAWKEAAERPQVEVTIDEPFAIGKHEVTFAQWDRCVEAGGCEHDPDDEGWGRSDRPVIHVSRSDAKQYARWLSETTGEDYRLPSEAEWEYAARAGTRTARWWGDELGEGRVPCDGCGTRWDERSTAPVGSFPANPWGLHDMLSNVSEWVADCWHDDLEGRPGDGSARVESSPWWKAEGWPERRGEECRRPVVRGGAYGYYPWAIRAADRSYWWPTSNWTERDGDSRGFRVVRAVAPDARP